MVAVCRGETSKADMLRESIDQYRQMYQLVNREFNKVADVSSHDDTSKMLVLTQPLLVCA